MKVFNYQNKTKKLGISLDNIMLKCKRFKANNESGMLGRCIK